MSGETLSLNSVQNASRSSNSASCPSSIPLFVRQAFGLVNEIKVGVMFERKIVNLKTLGQVAGNTVDGDSALRVVIETNPGTIRCRTIHFDFE